jgi:bifunctional non-homologous end joining protein LigD
MTEMTERKLEEYFSKRKFNKTPEPRGGKIEDKTQEPGKSFREPIFVIQRHDARNLHYDLRLEINGVLVSWAVPKGPPLEPGIRRLAVRTEDHPIEYAEFEGTIPEGEYGAGTVTIWDRGTYENLRENKKGKEEEIEEKVDISKSLEEGRIEILFKSRKIKGVYYLIRTNIKDGKEQWLLFKACQVKENDQK